MTYSCKNPTWQGYGPPTQMHKCNLPHTGHDLSLLFVFALAILLVGLFLRWGVKK